MDKRILFILGMICILCLSSSVFSANYVIEEYTTQNDNVQWGRVGSGDLQELAQGFVLDRNANILNYSIKIIALTGTHTGFYNLSIQYGNATAPNGTEISGSMATKDGSTITAGSWFNWTLPAPVYLTSGTQYWLVMTTNQSGVGQSINIGFNNGGGYADGIEDYRINGGSWLSIAGTDINFQVWGENASLSLVLANDLTPNNNTQYNTSTVNFNVTGNFTYSTNCTLSLNGTYNGTATNYTAGNNTNVTFSRTLNDGTWTYSINCTDGTMTASTSTYLLYVDTVIPSITWAMPSNNNNTVFANNMTAIINLTDQNLYSYQYNITYTNGTVISNFSNSNLTGNVSYNISDTVNMSNYTGTFYAVTKVCDGHTATEISTMTVTKSRDELKFNEVSIKSLTPTEDMTYIKKIDRYNFAFEYDTPRTEIQIEMPKECKYIGDKSKIAGHFVCYDKYWVDFVGDYDIKVDKRIVTVTSEKPLTKWDFNSIGELNCEVETRTFYVIGYNATYTSNVLENTTSNITLTLGGGVTSTLYNSTIRLIYNGTTYTPSESIYANYKTYTTNISIPSVNITTNVSFYFNYTINSNAYNTTNYTQSILDFHVYNNCSEINGTVILNMTMYDEESKVMIDPSVYNSTIELDLTFKDSSGGTWSYANFTTNTSNLALCVENDTFNMSDYTVDFVASYIASSYAQEFYYLDNGDLNGNCTFNSYTSCIISLYDLLLVDSTTFLFRFYDTNGLSPDDAIVHTYRDYIADGMFREVERSKQDDNGETHIHLVEEDVIYYFVVTQNGSIIYTSSNYNAKCISTPCLIELKANSDFTSFPTNWSYINGLTYTLLQNSSNRMLTLGYLANASSNISLFVYSYDNNNYTLLNSTSGVAVSGTLYLYVPVVYGNTTFYAVIGRDGTFVNYEFINFRDSGRDKFGTTGAIMGAFIIMAIAMMSVSEGIILLVAVCVSLFLITILFLIDFSWLAIISIICAGGIIAWKLLEGKR